MVPNCGNGLRLCATVFAPEIAGIRQFVEAALRGERRVETRRQQRPIGGVVEVETERSKPILADRIQVDQVVGGEPVSSIADVRDVDDDVAGNLALQRDVPLVELWHLAGVRMDPLRRRVDQARRRADAGIVVDLEQRVPVVDQPVTQQRARLTERRRLEVERVPATRAERRPAVGLTVSSLGVRDAPSTSKDGLRVDLIGHTNSRSEGVWVRLDEAAVARAGAVTFVDRGAQADRRPPG